MTPDFLKQIVDEVFSVLETATVGKPLVHALVSFVHTLALSLLPTILGNLKAKGA